MILIMGASGMLGSATARLLMDRKLKIRLATRERKRLQEFSAANVEIVKADLRLPHSLQEALAGVDTVIACAHSLMGRGKNGSFDVDAKGHKILIDLCREYSVNHFIYISTTIPADAGSEFIRNKAAAEEHLMRSKLPFTIVKASAFMEMHIHKLMGEGIVARNRATILGSGAAPTNYIAVADLARLLLKIVELGPANQIVTAGGPDNLSKIEIARLYEKLIGKDIKLKFIPAKRVELMSQIVRPFHAGISRMLQMVAATDLLDLSVDASGTAHRYNIEFTPVEAFIKEKLMSRK